MLKLNGFLDGYVTRSGRMQPVVLDADRAPSRRGMLVLAGLALVFCALAASCNTVEGAGKDISSVGHATSEEAREHSGH